MLNSGIVQTDLALRIEKLQQENEQLQTKLAESEARVGRLESATYMHEKFRAIGDLAGITNAVVEMGCRLHETKKQSLQHIQAHAVKDFMCALVDSIPDGRKVYPYEIQNYWIKYSNEQQANGSDGDE